MPAVQLRRHQERQLVSGRFPLQVRGMRTRDPDYLSRQDCDLPQARALGHAAGSAVAAADVQTNSFIANSFIESELELPGMSASVMVT
jgi:hypothetical protein